MSLSMLAETRKEEAVDTLLHNASLYCEFLSEREEILKHKWIESEKAGHDIGWEAALRDWVMKYRVAWKKDRQPPA